MTSPLHQLDIFELRPLITNFNCKLSTITEYDCHKQMLCLVSEDNDIVLRYNSEGGQEVIKMISWFRRTNRVIHDICFDPSGTWLLVLCFDNTLHIVPALAVVDKSGLEANNKKSIYPHTLYSTTQVTSYIIPFVGPHECPNSKKCPNKLTSKRNSGLASNSGGQPSKSGERVKDPQNPSHEGAADACNEEAELSRHLNNVADQLEALQVEDNNEDEDSMVVVAPINPVEGNMDIFSHDVPAEMLASSAPQNLAINDKTGNSQLPAMNMSFMASNTCPYPLSVVWWRTLDGVNRAVIGYSDGSICFVGLSPNCPFVASTAVESGSVVKLLICRDNTFESVMLLITSSLKQQFKLLLEQKAIDYIYPGEISPTTTQTKDNDWQIVLPLKNINIGGSTDSSTEFSNKPTSGATDDDDVFMNEETPPPKDTNPPQNSAQNIAAATTVTSKTSTEVISSIGSTENSQPPPPPYSVAISRHLENKDSTSTNAASAAAAPATGPLNQTDRMYQQQQQQQQQIDNESEFDKNIRGGYIPAARARLASLKSLGSKKLNAIKMRLSDKRQKIEEYMPDNSLGSSFAIVDSPSLTPELLANSAGSFYTIQNLRSTYLLSALHSQSNSFTVHSIDIHLKPLFLYKIPRECVDILISSNILYSIQYVDYYSGTSATSTIATASNQKPEQINQNTEKENRDMDVEKHEKYADVMAEVMKAIDEASGPHRPSTMKREASQEDSVADTSAASSTSEHYSQDSLTPSNSINAVGVISSAMASLRKGDEDKFNGFSQLGLFRFEHETVLSLYQMATFRPPTTNETISKDDKTKVFETNEIRSPMDYVKFYETADVKEEYSLRQMEIMQNEFPKINFDPCYVVTNKNVYYIQLKKEPFAIFLESALAGEWTQCRDFCNTFDLTYEACIEFAGDYLLRRKKVTQALLTYNTARIKPIRTALKLAMFGQTNALMHLCAMALKLTHVLKSKYFCHPIVKTLLHDITYRHSEDVQPILPPTPASYSADGKVEVNEGLPCSDYTYGVDEPMSQLQMSASSQFHLANLLLITLAEKAVNDKNYIPLWNFLVTNGKYHTNMTSIVLCQSGLFSAAILLAKVRGVFIDTFLALNSVVGQEFGWYSEVNVCLYNLSDTMFTETLTYLPSVTMGYFAFIQEKLQHIRPSVLKRLEQQLNPFSPTLRPIVSHTSSISHSNDNNTYLLEFCKNLIETYLAVLIHLESQRSRNDRVLNALNTFRLTYEDNQFAIEATRFKPISAGCAHCACVVDGVAYFWGSNGVPCNYSASKLSDSPEPPYAVKSLDLLAHLNLHVHAVKCGRQHTLILTNNGLYTLGNNNLCQLGIGKDMQMTLQPMLVKTFDGKNITILEAGQYHNAVVADGILYTWGWGVYGQLGHGDTENAAEPKMVSYLKYKKILQVSLGHAHTLVLCEGPSGHNNTELYVFGSNNFGQLGLAASKSEGEETSSSMAGNDSATYSNQVKYLLPQKLEIAGASRIRLIHTKFFTNLAVDENERMYTWGSSPQALRLANQIKRRANAKQKNEEQQRREMSKRFEETLNDNIDVTTVEVDLSSSSSTACEPSTAANLSEVTSSSSSSSVPVLTITTPLAETSLANTNDAPTSIVKDEISSISDNVVVMAAPAPVPDIIIEDEIVSDITVVKAAAASLPQTTQEKIETENDAGAASTSTSSAMPQVAAAATIIDVDPCEHMTPHLVDTSEVAGQILQVSSGLFHFALISSSCTLYTWGKNLEHQLGTEDKERRAVGKPSPIDSIDRPMYVDCGADFTLVMTTDFVVKAFGGNSNGQCGRDLGACIDNKMKQRVVCLPTTKRLMRFESQCVEVPVEINLPRPRIRLDYEPVRYLKTIPKYKCYFLQEAEIDFEQCPADMASSSANQISGQESDDMISSLENISQNEGSSLQMSPNMPLLATENLLDPNQLTANSSYECSPDEQSYARLPNVYNASSITDNGNGEGDGMSSAILNLKVQEGSLKNDSEDGSEELQQLGHYIHYCLYVFHGLYSPEKVREFSKDRLEYRIRTLMLNFKFVDAFELCLRSVNNASCALKIFEYFSKDTGYVPMRRADLRFLIYYLLQHFMERNYDLTQCENFFLADLDYYLLELAYVLYFNNNNTELEQNLNEKFKNLIARNDDPYQLHVVDDLNQQQQQQHLNQEMHHLATHKLQDTDVIFELLSVKFKTIICQRLLKFCNT
ncbi:RCC1 and BTB domain containing protein claret [Haematobia irritans]|uniref:RCC1 and BTB domain containing protein claret n=1 Tax=Haematobia irritans TaxID=7368 RepID=UPI003F4FD50C